MSGPTTFWARRRAGVQAEAEAELRATEQAAVQAKAEALAEKNDAEILAEMGLPDPAEMQQGDDFAAFMSREVPERLRRQALRTLWRSNPVLACVDGLNDYDDDYRAAALVKEPIKTAYQVGKGMLYHIEEMERKAARALAEVSGESEKLVSEDVGDGQQASVAVAAAEREPTSRPENQNSEVEESAPPLRRMRFRFEEASA